MHELKYSVLSALFLIPIVLISPGKSAAGISGVTRHSRANCFGFNESVTWYLHQSDTWKVISIHYPNPRTPAGAHTIDTGWSTTWRQAAYHPTEAYANRGDNYLVRGFHYRWTSAGEVLDEVTQQTGCGIYNGWWDY